MKPDGCAPMGNRDLIRLRARSRSSPRLLAQYGYEPLPKYTEPSEGPLASPELAKQFPLVLNTGARIQSTFRSQHLNIPSLLKLQPEPLS